jgi:hypothetical protein
MNTLYITTHNIKLYILHLCTFYAFQLYTYVYQVSCKKLYFASYEIIIYTQQLFTHNTSENKTEGANVWGKRDVCPYLKPHIQFNPHSLIY